MEADKRNIWWFEACFGHFLAWRGPQRPYPMVPNWRPSVPWEFEIHNCTMGWVNYGKTGCWSHGRQTKQYLMIWSMFRLFYGSEGPPRAPAGSPMAPNGQPSVLWKVKIKYFIMVLFNNGHFQALKIPPRATEGPQWFPMENIVCHEKLRGISLLWNYFTMGELGVSRTKGDQRNIW